MTPHASLPQVRNIRFEIGPDVPRYWHGGRRSVTVFFNNLSVFFPEGERFFIASVKAHRDFIRDDRLKAEAKAFYGQEGIHSREHVRYNTLLREQGYPVEAMEGRIGRLLGRVTRRVPLRKQLAVTAALEHFTALMAHLLLRDPTILAGAHPVMANLWRWHAAEENEHKAVAFDVYVAAGGTYFERALVMVFATLIFWVKVVEQQLRLMAADGMLFSAKEWLALGKFLFVSPGALRGLAPLYFAYFRRDFHPWHLDNHALLDDWKRDFDKAGARAYGT